MLLNKTIKTLSVVAVSIGALAPIPSQAATCSYASHYGVGDGYDGQLTASGERFNAYGNSAAHRSLPFGTKLIVTNKSNGKSVIVRINDRGPYVAGRNLDLSYGTFSSIASPSRGEIRVCYYEQ
jgi:rare lipoprotein A